MSFEDSLLWLSDAASFEVGRLRLNSRGVAYDSRRDETERPSLSALRGGKPQNVRHVVLDQLPSLKGN